MKTLAILVTAVAVGTLGNPAEKALGGPFDFQHHYIDRDLPGGSWAQTAVVDVDRDGRLDYITGQTRGPVLWYRQEGAGRWTRHTLGTNSPSDVGGAALDVDGDGWTDFITGGVWYRNSGRPLDGPFERIVFDADLAAVHDLVLADLDRDTRPEVLTMSDKNDLRWYRIPREPRHPWKRHQIGPGVHAGIGVGDLDGDGDLDVARSNWWFENADGRGTRWVTHQNIPFGNPNRPYPLATHCVALDLDRDGDTDLAMSENEIKGGRIGWLENLDGRGGTWRLHELPHGDTAVRGAYHSLIVADFDKDGDPDVFSCEMEGIPGDKPPRWFIWENADGKAGRFVEHVILDAGLGGHLVVAADVDEDGDLDLIGKLWRPRRDNANQGRNHVDWLENRLIDAAAPRDVIPVGTRPESVTRGFDGYYYVTVMGDPQPGDGVVKVIKGRQVEVFATGLDEPKGIAFVGGFLVTTDLKRVWKIDRLGQKSLLARETDFPQPVSYLNDTAAAPDGQGVFVTDMGARDRIMGPQGLWPLESAEARALPAIGRIYHITLEGRVRLIKDAAPVMACPNGICAPAADTWLVAEFFYGNILRITGTATDVLATGLRGADGIERAKNGAIYVSSWTQGKVWRLDQGSASPFVVLAGLRSAADLFVDEEAGLLLVPDMLDGTIHRVPLR